jgi:eukaryotic-like serine/threonine-protein kinase
MTNGTILAGKYRLVSLLGRGGMGSVWRAERLGWQAPVAIKLMNVPAAPDSLTLARFQREARLAASLRSVHVVQVLDDGVDTATGAPFIVMELLEGESLAERLLRVKRLRPPVVAQIISQIARALSRAHDAGLIHRDLKPDNILIVRNDDEELIKVLDFGIAKWIATSQKLGPGTLAGQMLGTPVYMSPEQLTSSAEIDHRSDLWSLGVIAHECMTGVRPFEGETLVRLAIRICSEEARAPSSIANVPEGFDAWFARAVAREVNDRFSSARIMAEELRGLCGQMPMLWQPEAAAPPEHATREKTELEPVLELTRRLRGAVIATAQPQVTEVDSVLPILHTPRPPARRGRLGLAIVGLLVTGIGLSLLAAPRWNGGAVDLVSTLDDLRGAVQGNPKAELAPQAAATSDSMPGPTPLATSPASEAQAEPAPVRSRMDRDAGSDSGAPGNDTTSR